MLGDLKEKPTSSLINDHAANLTLVWQKAHDKWRKLDDYYWQRFLLWPDAILNTIRPQIHLSTPRRVVDSAVDQQMAYEHHVHRPPTGDNEDAKAKADKIEPFLQAALDQISIDAISLPAKLIGKYLVHYGYAVVEGALLKAGYRAPEEPRRPEFDNGADYEDALMEWGMEKQDGSPYVINAPHPARVLMDPSKKRPDMAIKQSGWYSHELATLTQRKSRQRADVEVWSIGTNPWERIECYDYWSRYWHAVMVKGGSMLYIEKNTWGFVPFAHAFSSLGMEPTDCKEIEPQYLAVGILEPILDGLKMEAQAAAARHSALINASFAQMGTRKDAKEVSDQLGQAGILDNMDSEDVWFVKFPDLPAWMFEQQRLIDQDIELGTNSKSQGGFPLQGVNTVGQQAMLDTKGERRFIYPTKQLEFLMSIGTSNILRLLDIGREEVTIRGNTLKPSDIEHDYSVEVTYKLVDPVLHMQEQQLALIERDKRLIGDEDYWALSGKENPTAIRRHLLEDLVRSDPGVIKGMAMEVAKGMGVGNYYGKPPEQVAAEFAQQNGQETPPQGQGLLDQFGQPMFAPKGQPTAQPAMPGSPQAAAQAINALRQPLTPQVAKPAPVRGPVPQGLGG